MGFVCARTVLGREAQNLRLKLSEHGAVLNGIYGSRGDGMSKGRCRGVEKPYHCRNHKSSITLYCCNATACQITTSEIILGFCNLSATTREKEVPKLQGQRSVFTSYGGHVHFAILTRWMEIQIE